eukprot:TRINITY_DN5018_c0_g1_i1.p1 TRINITY_DN5018_c0_g1~~TRINITY_DN5018_c0_g1_i1.p1  ORF type:complete len:288 (+),score=27.32 TRINITY_DN5018_c0_g1_i1:88-951(+)
MLRTIRSFSTSQTPVQGAPGRGRAIVISLAAILAGGSIVYFSNKKKSDSWEGHVLPHEPFYEVVPRLWKVSGKLPYVPLPRSMNVYVMKNGGLFVHSAFAMQEEDMKKLERLGPLEILLVPSGGHRLDAGVYKQRYPAMKVVCPKGAEQKVSEIVAVDAFAEDVFKEGNPYGVRCLHPPLKSVKELCYEVDLDGKKKGLIVNDVMMNLPPADSLAGRIMQQIVGTKGDGAVPTVARHWKYLISTSTKEYREFIDSLANKNYNVVTFSHGNPIVGDTSKNLKETVKNF